MQEVFSKIIEKLETYSDADEAEQYGMIPVIELDKAIEIVKQEAEQYNNGWIQCSEHQPEEAGTYNITAYDGRKLRSTHAKWQPRLKSWNLTGTMAYWKVIAWQPLPQPYQPKGEREAWTHISVTDAESFTARIQRLRQNAQYTANMCRW